MRFTVVIPVYNDAGRVGRAIQSVLEQTMPDFELLVIDDGSTDNSAEVVSRFDDPRLRLIRNEKNLGCGGTKNKGLSLAAAPCFKALDSDDWLEPTCLERALEVFASHPEVALVTSAASEHIEGGSDQTRLRENRGPEGRYGLHEGRAVQSLYFHGRSAGNPSQVSLRTEWARRVGGWDGRLVNGDEGALWLRIVDQRQAFFISEPLVHISLHERSLTAQASRTGLEVLHISQMFKDVMVDIPELDRAANRFWLVWTRGYGWFARSQKLIRRCQFKDALLCLYQIAYFAPLPWWFPVFLGRMFYRGLSRMLMPRIQETS